MLIHKTHVYSVYLHLFANYLSYNLLLCFGFVFGVLDILVYMYGFFSLDLTFFYNVFYIWFLWAKVYVKIGLFVHVSNYPCMI